MAGEEIANVQPGEYAPLAYEHNVRDLLFDDLSHGRIEPAQAEERARELGLAPLSPTLDVALYDPMAENYWTLAMVVNWIAWRDVDRLRDVLPSWRRDHQDWFYRDYRVPDGAGAWVTRSGWILERVHKGEAPFLFLSLCEAIEASESAGIDPAMRRTIRGAREDLWLELGAGRVMATTATEGASIFQIPPHEWAFLEHGESRGRDVLYVRNDTWRGPKYAGEVLISRQNVLSIWPIEPVTACREEQSASAAEWYITTGRTRAETNLRERKERISESSKSKEGASIWNALYPDRAVKPESLNRARKRSAKIKGTRGHVKGGASG